MKKDSINLQKLFFVTELFGNDGSKTIDTRDYNRGVFIYKLITSGKTFTNKFTLN